MHDDLPDELRWLRLEDELPPASVPRRARRAEAVRLGRGRDSFHDLGPLVGVEREHDLTPAARFRRRRTLAAVDPIGHLASVGVEETHVAEIGRGARIRRCIIDKHVKIPPNDVIGFNKDDDAKRFHVTENGLVVIRKNLVVEPLKR